MKFFLLLLSIGILVASCNRPMPQPPDAQTPTVELVTATNTASTQAPPVSTLKVTPTATNPRIMVITTQPPTNLPTQWSSATSKPTPYPTPAWCPVAPVQSATSGKLRLIYVSQGDLLLKDEGESAKQLSTSGDIKQVSLSDDGQIIAFTRHLDENHQDLWTINVDGSNEQRLVSVDELVKMDGTKDALGVSPIGLQWEPGKQHFTFYTYPIFDGIWIFEPTQVWLADLNSSEISSAPYQGGYISYSPDGNRVAIFNKNGISLANLDGSNIRENVLPDYHGIGEGESYYDPWPHWASDSSSILVALPDEDGMYHNEAKMTLWRVPVEGEPHVIGQWKAFSPSVSFSPDQKYLAYWPWPEGATNQRELHLSSMNITAGEQPVDAGYYQGSITQLNWASDSQHFLFEVPGENEQTQLYLGHVCEQPVVIHESASSFTAMWIDASRYLLESNVPGDLDKLELFMGDIRQDQKVSWGIATAYDWTILP